MTLTMLVQALQRTQDEPVATGRSLEPPEGENHPAAFTMLEAGRRKGGLATFQ